MADYGSKMADKAIKEIDRKLQQTYKTAKKELEEKLADFTRRHAENDKKKQKQLAEGKISKEDYQNWLAGQVFIRGQWESKIRQVTKVMHSTNEQAVNIINEGKLDVFSENYNYQAFLAEQGLGIGISFNLYNSQSVARLIRDDPQILPEWKIDEQKDYKWNYQKVNNIVKQGIIQGESVQQIGSRLCNDLAAFNERKMMLFARTAITGAQNAGRQQQMNDAAEMGIDVHKQWLATLDGRTRDAHRDLDGQEVPYNEDFDSILGPIEYPGDPSADPANVYNCRCTMVTIYPKYERRQQNNWRESEVIDGVSYKEWKKGKESQIVLFTSKNNDDRISKRADSVNKPIESRTGLNGRASAISHFDKGLNNRQQRLLDSMPDYDSWTEVKKSDVNMSDLSALTAVTGNEFALFTRKGKRLIIRGNENGVNVNVKKARELFEKGYKWSGHTHPGDGVNVLLASEGDLAILRAFEQEVGCIWGETGNFMLFDKGGE